MTSFATAHHQRWQTTYLNDDQAAAQRYAQRAVQLDPNHKASYALMRTLKEPPAPNVVVHHSPPKPKQMIWIGLALLVAFVVAYVFSNVLVDDTPAPPPVESSVPPPPPVEAPPPPPAPSPATSGTFERDIPLEWIPGTNTEGLQLDTQRSRIYGYTDSYSFRLHANVLVADAELHRLRLKMEMLDDGGQVLHSKSFDALSDHMPPLRPGDSAPISDLIHESIAPPDVQLVRLTPEIVEREPAAADYGPVVSVPLTWETAQTGGFSLELSERESRITSLVRERAHFLSLAVQNTGERTVSRLTFSVTWFDAQDQPLTSENKLVVLTNGPALRAGETRVVRVIGKFPLGDNAPFDRYAVSVTEAQ